MRKVLATDCPWTMPLTQRGRHMDQIQFVPDLSRIGLTVGAIDTQERQPTGHI
jgi:hypothetical protein